LVLLLEVSLKAKKRGCRKSFWNPTRDIVGRISEAGTVYNFDTIDVDGKPEVQFKYLKRLVGEREF
jgi:hypothetical protein